MTVDANNPMRSAAIQALASRGVKPESMTAAAYEEAVQKQVKAISATCSYVVMQRLAPAEIGTKLSQ